MSSFRTCFLAFYFQDSAMLLDTAKSTPFSVLHTISLYAYTTIYKSILFSVDEYLSCFDFCYYEQCCCQHSYFYLLVHMYKSISSYKAKSGIVGLIGYAEITLIRQI